MTRRLPILSLFLLLPACSEDPADPCAAAPACEVTGVDLAIDEIDVDWTDDQPIHASYARHVVQPGDEVHLIARIVNRGDERSEAAGILFEGQDPDGRWYSDGGPVAVPALEPGESYDAVILVQAPEYMRFYENEMAYTLSLVDAGGDHGSLDDAEPLNDRLASEHVVVALPVLELHTEVPSQAQTATPFEALVVIENESPFPTGEITMGFCLFDFDVGCTPDMPGFSLVEVPSIEAFGTVAIEPMVDIDPASSYPEPYSWTFVTCALPADAGLEQLHDNSQRGCFGGTRILVTQNQ